MGRNGGVAREPGVRATAAYARLGNGRLIMAASTAREPKDGAKYKVIAGTHAGKSGTVTDIKTSKTGHVTVTVIQANGERFKTLAKNLG